MTLRPIAFALSLLAFAACDRAPPAAPAPASARPSAPAKPPPDRASRLKDFLRERYGAQATATGEWQGEWQDPDGGDAPPRKLAWRVCAEQPVVIGEVWRELLAVCGQLDGAGHPEPGVVDFHVLRPAGDGFAPEAELPGQIFGSNGNPGSVSVLRLGRDLYAFRIEHGWYGQGYALISQDLVVPGRDGLFAAGSLRSHIDNAGALDCDGDETADCRAGLFDVDFELQPDDSDRMAERWPLRVNEHGHACGKDVQAQHTIAADPKTGRYAFPDALRREGCQ